MLGKISKVPTGDRVKHFSVGRSSPLEYAFFLYQQPRRQQEVFENHVQPHAFMIFPSIIARKKCGENWMDSNRLTAVGRFAVH